MSDAPKPFILSALTYMQSRASAWDWRRVRRNSSAPAVAGHAAARSWGLRPRTGNGEWIDAGCRKGPTCVSKVLSAQVVDRASRISTHGGFGAAPRFASTTSPTVGPGEYDVADPVARRLLSQSSLSSLRQQPAFSFGGPSTDARFPLGLDDYHQARWRSLPLEAPIHSAARLPPAAARALVRILVDARADPQKGDQFGQTALAVFAAAEHADDADAEAVRALLAAVAID